VIREAEAEERHRQRDKRQRQKRRETYRQEKTVRCQWLTPVILATQETEIRKIAVRSQPWHSL
jgi:hypothetical protein